MFINKGFCLRSKQGFNATNRGFTLVELMIVLAVLAIGVALAVPSYSDVMQRRETTAQAEELVTFVAFAQSEAVKYNEMISVHVTYTDKDNWCIGANEGSAACDCTVTDTDAANYCSLNGVAIRGTMAVADLGTNHGVTLGSDNGNWALQIDVGATGRTRICNPDSTMAVPGYKSCPSFGIRPIRPAR